MFRFIKKVLIIVFISTANSLKSISLKNPECKVREVVVKSEHMTFSYDIKVNRCSGNCNSITNPYAKVCVPDIIKNVTVKMFDLMTLTNKTKQVIFHENCKCICRLDPIVCCKKQGFNKDKCRCECLINKKCDEDFVWNINNCECEYKKAAKLISEKCEEIIHDITQNKTVSITKYVENCKPFVASSILFVSVSIILSGIMIYFCVKSRNNVLPY